MDSLWVARAWQCLCALLKLVTGILSVGEGPHHCRGTQGQGPVCTTALADQRRFQSTDYAIVTLHQNPFNFRAQ